ncbi:hypothetical protein BCR44DRAFT_1440116 [Catenaria anguillulae PL171]|uniref:Uncharacterized protein n=1 Tax=Catenaria anguillulae PL171 TaxID=765915 RepID=A0A1Y2HFT9_9FUNG|nr:hypothetical protein BCR44DRAFT_1440116 [Catenaria anguillulae PL171]
MFATMSAGISSAHAPRPAPTSPVSELSTVTNLSAFTAMSSTSPSPDMNLIVQERDALRQQNEQLWALVEKQRQVIFSLKTQITQLRQGAVAADGSSAVAQAQVSTPMSVSAAVATGGLGPTPSPTTAMLESPSLALPPNGPVPSASEAATFAAQQQQQQPRQRTPPMQMVPQRANTTDASMALPSSSIPTPPNDPPMPSAAPARSRSFSNPTAPLQSSALASNPPMAVPALPPKVISAPPTTSSPPAILSPVRATMAPPMTPGASISSAPAPAPPSRSNTYPANAMPSSSSSPDNNSQLAQPQPSTPQRSATLDQLPSSPASASAKSSPRKSLTITPMRVATASDHIEPLSPKPVVAGGPASRASVISLNDPRYSYLAYYDDLMTDPDEDEAKSTTTSASSAAPNPLTSEPPLSAAEAAEQADQLTDLASAAAPGSATGSPAKKSIVPANKAFRLGRLRPSSQLADHEVRPSARVQFAAETFIHEASDEEWGSEGEESFTNGGALGDDAQWGNSGGNNNDEYYEDDGESVDGSDLTGSDMAVAVAPTTFQQQQQQPQSQGQVQFPQRSRSSMAAPPPHSSSSRMSQASGRVPPPRQHSRTHARDSIFLTKKNGGMYNPPRAFVNETRMSMMGNAPAPSAMAALLQGQGATTSGLPQPSAAPQFPTRGAASIHRGGDAGVSSPTTAGPPVPLPPTQQSGLPPMRTAASPSAARASQFYQQQQHHHQQQQQHPIDQIDEELIRRLLSGDRSQLQEQLKGLSPTQIAALQNMLRDRMGGPGQGGQQQPGAGGRPMSPRTTGP